MTSVPRDTAPRFSRTVLVFVLALHALPFLVRPALIGGDEPHYALMAWSLAVDHDIDLTDEYRAVELGSPAAGSRFASRHLDSHTRDWAGRRVFSHPLGLPLLAAPLIAAEQALAPGTAPDRLLGGLTLLVTFAALLAGWRMLAEELGDARTATLLGLGLYFASPLWFYSRTFFTEPYLWGFLVLAVACLRRERWLTGSLLLAAALACKETAALAVVPLLLLLWRRAGWRAAAQTAAFPLVFAILFLLKNHWVYGRLLVTFQPFQLGDPLRGAAGVIFDPSHGLLPFAPILLILPLGMRRADGDPSRLDDPAAWGLLIFLLFFGLNAAWVDWRGGSCYGPRLLVPALPALAPLLVRAWQRHNGKFWFRRAIYGLLLAGFVVQWCAANDPFHAFWSIRVDRLLLAHPVMALTGAFLGCGWLFLWNRSLLRGVDHNESAIRRAISA